MARWPGSASFRRAVDTPATLAIVPEARIVLDGIVSGLGLDNRQGNFATNLPLPGATVEVYATDPTTGLRVGPAAHLTTVGADGRWGPFVADGAARYEFVIAAPGYATTHIYRSPFPRSSSVLSLRPERLADADRDARSLVTLSRPRGYFGVPRDRVALDGKSPPADIPSGVAALSAARRSSRMPSSAALNSLPGRFSSGSTRRKVRRATKSLPVSRG